MRITSDKQPERLIVALTGSFDAGRPLYVQTVDVAELRQAVEEIDPSVTFEVVKPVSPVFAVAYLAMIAKKEQEAACQTFTHNQHAQDYEGQQLCDVCGKWSWEHDGSALSGASRVLPESDIRKQDSDTYGVAS